MCPGRGVEGWGHEVQAAGARELRSVGQAHSHLQITPGPDQLARPPVLLPREELAGRRTERHVHRVQAVDRGQEVGGACHPSADVEHGASHAARDLGPDLGVVEVFLRLLEGGLGRVGLGARIVHVLLRDGVLRHQRLEPLQGALADLGERVIDLAEEGLLAAAEAEREGLDVLRRGEVHLVGQVVLVQGHVLVQGALGVLEARAGGTVRGVVADPVEAIQQLPRLHHRPFGERPVLDDAVHAGAHFHPAVGRHLAAELVRLRYGARLHHHDRYVGRWERRRSTSPPTSERHQRQREPPHVSPRPYHANPLPMEDG